MFGAGLVGSLLTLYLRQRGLPVDVYERRPDPRRADVPGGRSINLALSDRGLRALAGVGLDEAVRAFALPMRGRMIHDPAGHLTKQPYGTADQCIYSVSRARLNELLIDRAEAAGATVHFNHRCEEVDWEAGTARVSEGDNARTVTAEVIFGADGAFSAVRGALQRTDRFDYEQSYLPHGYKEVTFTPTADGDWALDPAALHIWPRREFMLIALPNPDRSFTGTLFLPFEGDVSFAGLTSPERFEAFFAEHFADALPLLPHLREEWSANPTASMVTIHCYPWVRGRTALIGDAAHAIVPFYGQGMNAGFEDCRVLNDLMDQHAAWPALLDAYQHRRKPSADAIAELALRNFVEMRDRVADPEFLHQKELEAQLHAAHPDEWLPLYSMVTFSHLPYEEALRRGKAQGELMRRVMREHDGAPDDVLLREALRRRRERAAVSA
ncbi:MAG: NAD(P)/FAD-dependent oxidoreductase [Catalinimonas sp.]